MGDFRQMRLLVWLILTALMLAVVIVSDRLAGLWILAFPVFLVLVSVGARIVYRRRSASP